MKVIGITPLYDDEKESYWMLPGYMQMLEEQGAITMMLPLTNKPSVLDYFLSICDGFVFSGGHDIDPKLFGEELSPYSGRLNSLRDEMDEYLMKRAIEKDLLVLGICRGEQLLNVFYGGTLYQDLPSEFGNKLNHRMTRPYDRIAHDVLVEKDSPLYEILKEERIGVNSYHHQAIKDLSNKLKVMAKSEDGIIEAIYMPGKTFVFGLQWHPEFSFKSDINSKKIIEYMMSRK